MAKNLIDRIANKLKKMNEDIKNTTETTENQQEEQNANTETQQPATDSPDDATQTTDNVAETAPVDPAKEWEAKYNEMNDKYLRLYSEFDNYKRRTTRERIELLSTAGADMLKTMLPVLDDFDRGFKNMEKATDVLALREGVELIYLKFKNTLQSKGLEEMKALGEPFDADMHEAITNVSAGDDMKGKVVDELEKGYYLHGKVIRYAKVVVGN